MSSKKKPRLSLELAFAYLLPMPSLFAGLAWTIFFTASSFLIAWLEDYPVTWERNGVSSLTSFGLLLIVTSLVLGMIPAIGRWSAASEEWDFHNRRPPMNNKERWAAEKKMLAGKELGGAWLANIFGCVAGSALIYFVVIEGDLSFLSSPTILWSGTLMILLFILLGRGIAKSRQAKARRKILLDLADKVDLLDLTPQYRAARYAVRSGLTWLAGATLSSFFFLLGGSWITISILIFISVLAGMSLVPILLRLQYRIRNAKKEELTLLRTEIVPLRDDALHAKTANPGRLADLLSYMLHVESLPELPFDKSKMAAVSLYLIVPLGSWLWITAVQQLLHALPLAG